MGGLSIVVLGIVSGLACALSQSGAYVFSRLLLLRTRSSVLRFLVLSHILMGMASGIILILMRPRDIPPISVYGPSMLAAMGFYIVGQAGLLTLMRFTAPSSVAPLLGLKIVTLAVLNLLLFGEQLHVAQWSAVALSAAAALVLNAAGGKLRPAAMLLVLCACTGYSLSDLGIAALVRHLGEPGSVRAAVLATVLCHILLGAIALVLLAVLREPWDLRAYARLGAPYAALWFLAMLLFFFTIACVGPVYAVILQSTRGLWSVLAGALIAHLGWVQVEDRHAHHVVLRRVLAALMMIAAIWLYSRG